MTRLYSLSVFLVKSNGHLLQAIVLFRYIHGHRLWLLLLHMAAVVAQEYIVEENQLVALVSIRAKPTVSVGTFVTSEDNLLMLMPFHLAARLAISNCTPRVDAVTTSSCRTTTCALSLL